jgi:hypothetical protein
MPMSLEEYGAEVMRVYNAPDRTTPARRAACDQIWANMKPILDQLIERCETMISEGASAVDLVDFFHAAIAIYAASDDRADPTVMAAMLVVRAAQRPAETTR